MRYSILGEAGHYFVEGKVRWQETKRISCLHISMGSSVLAFQADLDDNNRKIAPDFYGYVMKDDERAMVLSFVAMTTMTCSYVSMKTIAVSSLMCVSGTWLIFYLGGRRHVPLLVIQGSALRFPPLGQHQGGSLLRFLLTSRVTLN